MAVSKDICLHTDRLYRALKGSDLEVSDVARGIRDDAQRLGFPPAESASAWIQAAARGDYEEMWRLSDENWRLCRAQAWPWSNRAQLGLDSMTTSQLSRPRATTESIGLEAAICSD